MPIERIILLDKEFWTKKFQGKVMWDDLILANLKVQNNGFPRAEEGHRILSYLTRDANLLLPLLQSNWLQYTLYCYILQRYSLQYLSPLLTTIKGFRSTFLFDYGSFNSVWLWELQLLKVYTLQLLLFPQTELFHSWSTWLPPENRDEQ